MIGIESKKVIFFDGKYYRAGTVPGWLTLEHFLFTHTLHYGGAAFEGGRCYPNKLKNDGTLNIIGLDLRVDRFFRSIQSIWINRPENARRWWEQFKSSHPEIAQKYEEFFKSNDAKVNKRDIETFPLKKDEMRKAILNTLLLNVWSGNIDPKAGGYWRPLSWVGARDDRSLGVFSMHHPKHFMIAAIPWGKYIGDLEFNRGAPVMVAEEGDSEDNRRSKLASNYATGQRLKNRAMYNRFAEMLLTDKSPERNLLEGTGENLLFYIGDNKWITPKQDDQPILPGTTLKTLIKILELTGHTVTYRDIPLKEVLEGGVKGGAMCGTAAEVTPLCLVYDSLTHKTVELEVPEELKQLQQHYINLVHGLDVPDAVKPLQKELITEIKWNDKEHAKLAEQVVYKAEAKKVKH